MLSDYFFLWSSCVLSNKFSLETDNTILYMGMLSVHTNPLIKALGELIFQAYVACSCSSNKLILM